MPCLACRYDEFVPKRRPSLVVLPMPLEGTVYDYTFDKPTLGCVSKHALAGGSALRQLQGMQRSHRGPCPLVQM